MTKNFWNRIQYITSLRHSCLKGSLFALLLFAGIGAKAQYVFMRNNGSSTYYYANGATWSNATSFNPDYIWTLSNNVPLNNGRYLNISRSGGMGNRTFTPSLGTTRSTTYTLEISNGNTIYHDYVLGNRYLTYDFGNLSGNASSANQVVAYQVTTTGHSLADNTTLPTISINSVSANTITLSRTNLTGSYTEAYTTYHFNNADHNWYNNTDNGNTAPTVNVSTLSPTYTWSLTANGGGVASIDPSTGVLTLSGEPTANITVRLTVSNISPLGNKTVDFTLTRAAVAESTTTTATISTPTLTPISATLSAGEEQEFTASATASATLTTTPAHTRLTGGGNTYYYYNNTLNTSAPTSAETSTTVTPTYTWSITGAASSNLSLSTTSGNTTTVTHSTGAQTNASATLTVTASTPGATDQTATATINVTPINPTAIEAWDATVYVGKEGSVGYELTPFEAYNRVVVSSSNSGIFTVTSPATGGSVTVTPVATGEATLTLTALNLDGSNGPSTTATVTVRDICATPVINVSVSGSTVTATITSATPGVTIHYVVGDNPEDPDENSATYSGPITVTDGQIIKAIAIKGDYWDDSEVATKTVSPLDYVVQGTSGTTVTLKDIEDHSWSYYSDAECPIRSLNPADVKITYYGNGTNNISTTNGATPADNSWTQSATTVAVGPDATANTFIYYKTLERTDGATATTVEGATGRCAYTTIPNPFSIRPTYQYATGTLNKYCGFYAWRVKSVTGGSIYTAATGGTQIAANGVINAETEVYFAPSSEYGMEVELEALWARAYVVTSNTTTGLNNSVTYERNFVYLSSNTTLRDAALSYPVTYTTLDPATGSETKRTITIRDDFTCEANTKFENVTFAQYNNNDQTITANGHDFIIGRGCSGTINYVRGIDGDITDPNYSIRIESGTYNYVSLLKGYYYSASNPTDGTGTIRGTMAIRSTIGCDYDRAANNNGICNNPIINYNLFQGYNVTINGNESNETVKLWVKSGKIGNSFTINNSFTATAYNTLYLGVAGTSAKGLRRLYIEGGQLASVAGGIDNDNQGENNNHVKSFYVRMTGGHIRGALYGGGARSPGSGDRDFVITGGTITGWLGAGCNGEAGTGSTYAGQTYGESKVYFGGNAISGGTGSNVSINGSTGGVVFGAGKGVQGNTSSGQMTYGTTVVVADDCDIENNVYGGGNYGYALDATNVYVCGGTVHGSVFGGSNQNNGPVVNVTMKGGTVEGDVYGGSNQSGNITGAVNVKVYGGTVQGAVYGCNNAGGTPLSTVNVDIYGTDPTRVVTEKDEHGNDVTTYVYGLNGVYGGGNLAAYVPTTTGAITQVSVNGCETSIKDVYGGGNAAPVPSTKVIINGGEIDRVFAGGNGESGTAAHVGYNTTNDTPSNGYGTGTASLTITNGSIQQVFGGSNSKGSIRGASTIDVNKGDDSCELRISQLFGGGNFAAGKPATINVGCTGSYDEGEGITQLYGGANEADVDGNIELNITGGNINQVFGGNNKDGDINGTITINVEITNTCDNHIDNVFGGGNQAAYTGNPTVNIKHGTIYGSVFGGGFGNEEDHTKGRIVGNPKITIGDDNAAHEVTIEGDIYGGGDNGNVTGTPVIHVLAKDNTTIGSVYGGGNASSVGGTDVTIDGGTIGLVFGGGHGAAAELDFGFEGVAADVNGNAAVKVIGGTIGQIFAGSNLNGTITGSTGVNINKTGTCAMIIGEVYGGGNQANGNAGTITIGCTGTLTTQASEPDSIGRSLEGIGAVYGGANEAYVGTAEVPSNINIEITSGIVGHVYGGNNSSGDVYGDITVKINKNASATCADNWYMGSVFGGGFGQETKTEGSVDVIIDGASVISGDVYGGSALGQVNSGTEDHTNVTLKSGIINGSVYGGGLGQKDGFYDATSDIAAIVGGNVTVTLDGSAVTGNIFGCNNLNGTPRGHVKVWVKRTVGWTGHDLSAGKLDDSIAKGTGVYEVAAVYGGGNLAAYEPASNTEKTEVIIDGCDNSSIQNVYGGGNAASVPATNVTVNGSYEIEYLFGGGNGKDALPNGEPNPGADVGYLSGVEYGTGITEVNAFGGTIHHVFGGSNTLGDVRSSSVAFLDEGDSSCTLHIDEIYGGGNEAYMSGDSNVKLGCITYMKELYGGAKAANIGGDIDLTITSGHFDRVFGGNNISGSINGFIRVNIEETGCNPITIGELYGCGNAASYTTPAGKADPTINIRSFTSIGRVFGGGLGKTAIVYGNPTVNINEVVGKNASMASSYAGQVVNFSDGTSVTLPEHTAGAIGAIRTVFGGGNAAKVEGNTNVNIGTATQTVFETPETDSESDRTKNVEGANVVGDVFGGGNQAEVTGNTNVVIGR